MGRNTSELYESIDKGREGKNIGISTGIPALDKVIYGIQKKCIYTFGAGSGGGKSTWALYLLYNIFEKRKDYDFFRIVMYSLELSPTVLLAKLLSLRIFLTEGIRISYKTILSLSEPISKEDYDMIISCKPWLEELEEYIIIFNGALNANKFVEHQKGIYETYGRFDKVGEQTVYLPKSDNYLILTMIDHISLISSPGGHNMKKPEIDLIVKFCIDFRDICGGTYFFIQQLNRQSQSVDRLKTEASSEINLSDFRDTSDTCNASEVVIALFNPYREKMVTSRGYQISGPQGLRDKIRFAQILKNRFGESEGSIALNFMGDVGFFQQLPKAKDMTPEDYKLYGEFEEEEVDEKPKESKKFRL